MDDILGEIKEISEYGARLAKTGLDASSVGEPIAAVITFHDGETVEIQGQVMRIDASDDAAVILLNGIPESRMMKEQVYLVKRFHDAL